MRAPSNLLRTIVLVTALAFIAMLAALTVDDIVTYGVTPLDVLSVLVLALFTFGIVGALRARPPQ